jgi:excisionase family DNA binding protein
MANIPNNENDPNLNTEPLWTVEEVAQYLRLQPETVRVMSRRGELPCLKVGTKVWRYKPRDVKEWLNLQNEQKIESI